MKGDRRTPYAVLGSELEPARVAAVQAFDTARAAGDADAMADAALALVGMQVFGTVPGRIPAFLHEAYVHADGARRAELAVAIARTWAYGGHPDRAAEFAAEALAVAESVGDPTLLARALDAALLARWGPDDLDERLRITARLEDTVAYVGDAEVRMSAHLWRLTTSLEQLDVSAIRRQLRALDALANETGSARVRFFADSRRAMQALLVGDLDEAVRARDSAVAAGRDASEADAFAIERALSAPIARQRGDVAAMAAEAEVFEGFGLGEGLLSVAAQGAQLWAAVGETQRASELLHQLAGADFSRIPRDVDWLLTVTTLTEVAAFVGETSLCAHAIEALTPYAGRGVVDAGAVGFEGVVDHYLSMAADVIGHTDDAQQWRQSAAAAYRQVGATWWSGRCTTAGSVSSRSAVLRPAAPGLWEVGRTGGATTMRDMRGLHYLRLLLERPGVDVSALELSDAVAGHPGAGVGPDHGAPVLDRRALNSYRQRLRAIDSELDEAAQWADSGRAERLERERDAVLAEVRAATGLGGRERTAPAAAERARVAVRKAIAAAIDRITELDPALGRLLRDTVVTGTACRYNPDPDRPIEWIL